MAVTDTIEEEKVAGSYQAIFAALHMVGTGAAIGLFNRALTWPLERAFYLASDVSNTTPLQSIYRSLFRVSEAKFLVSSFLSTGLVQTIGKSAANLGVLYYVDCTYANANPIYKGLISACFSAPSETLVTSRGEYRKINAFYKLDLVHANSYRALLSVKFGRVVLANFIRNFNTSLITFGGMFALGGLIKKNLPLPQDSAVTTGVSVALSNIVIQPMNMPFLNYQTYVLRAPDRPVAESLKSFFDIRTQAGRERMFKGTTARVVHRGVFYGLSFMASEMIKNAGARSSKPSGVKPHQ